jgi:TPR repeat protein/signal transduction histidine kinase
MTEPNTFAIAELEQKANEGDAQAQFDLALYYVKAKDVEANMELAFAWDKKAAEQGHVNAQFALGLYYFLAKNRDHTREFLNKWGHFIVSSEPIDPAFDLGVNWASKNSFSEADGDLAFKWLNKAAEQGHAEANYCVGICYRHGIGTECNNELAFESYKKAAEQGYTNAYYWLARCYYEGKGIEQSDKLTAEWITSAVELAEVDPEAYLILGHLYADGKGVQQNAELAFKWYEKAAEKEVAEAHYCLANFYSEGRSVEKDNGLALEHYEKAAQHGHILAKNRQGEMYFCTGGMTIFGKDDEKEYDLEQAFDFLTKSIECGHLQAFEKLAKIYCIADFNQSYSMAINWYEEAVKQGHTEAEKWLAKICTRYGAIYYAGLGVEKDDQIFFKLHQKAAEYGSVEACFSLSFFLLSQAKNNEKIGEVVFEGFKMIIEQSQDSDTKLKANTLLAHCYKEGIGTEQNFDLARYHSQLGSDVSEWHKEITFLPPKSQIAKENVAEILSIYFTNNDSDAASRFVEQAFENPKGIEKGFKNVSLMAINQKKELIKKNQELEEKNKQLQASQIELEDMMSMFAHKFRSPLDAIIYNTTHENQVKLYTEAAQTMRGLLNIFSIISTDVDILKDKIKQDYQGGGSLATVVSKTLDMILLHLLSVSGAEKIQQHYMAYAQRHGQCNESVSYKIWCEDYFELEQALQTEWEASYAQLLNQSNSLEQRLAWLEERFFKLDIIGFERTDIQFKEYGTTESLLTILLNEILVNAFKYYSSTSKQSVVLEWAEREDYQVLICSNPSLRSERIIIKGSHKGHVFLSTLARKTGGLFNKPIPQDHFVLEFGIPNELLISK